MPTPASGEKALNPSTQPEVDFSFVRYANCWEDPRLLLAALEPAPGKRILSIASAGDNALSLLASGAEVVAVDLNPAQLACAELRKEAIRVMDRETFLGFAGFREETSRLQSYAALRPALQPPTQRYWDAHQEDLASGFIHQGKFERYFRKFRKVVLPLIHGRAAIAELMRAKVQEARERYYQQHWNNRRWRLLFRVFFSRWMMGRLGRDPAFFEQVEGAVSSRILERTRYALSTLDTSDNPFLTYILTGNFQTQLPHYLQPENYPCIQKHIDQLSLKQGCIDAVAGEYGPAYFDGFNLSDIFEYLSLEQCEQVYGRLLDAARPGARLAYWNMLAPRSCPPGLADRVRPQQELADRLFLQDQAFFYSRFVVEEVL